MKIKKLAIAALLGLSTTVSMIVVSQGQASAVIPPFCDIPNSWCEENPNPQKVPEPGTAATLLAVGAIGGISLLKRRSQNKAITNDK